MTISELQIQLDISTENATKVLKQYAHKISYGFYGYLFVDSDDGQCYLFDEHGHLDDISNVKCIQDYAFWYCKSLKSIIIPDSAKSIRDRAFYYCTSLESITIPDSVESIGDWAFYNCTSLENIIIPDSVKSIEKCTFEHCTSLKKVIFKGKKMDQIKAMTNYPWGITDISIIKYQMS